ERDKELNNTGFNPAGTTLGLLPPVDLVAGTIVLPVNGTPGQMATIAYTVSNGSATAAQGKWTDSLYVSSDRTWDINDKLFARHEQSGPLAGGETYTASATAPLPGVKPGEYFLIIRSDILNQIPESNEENNLGASVDSVSLDVPALTLDTASAGTIGQGQGVYYRVTVGAGETLLIDFDTATTASNASTQLFVKFGDVPTRASFDFGSDKALAADQKIVVPKTKAGTYYVLAYGDSLPAATAFSIEARALAFEVIDTSYGIGGNGGKLTLQINGAKFDRSVLPTLVSPGGSARAAEKVFYTSTTRLYATFDLSGLTPNAYDVKLTRSSGESVTAPDSLSVVPARPAEARPVIFSPPITGVGGLFQFTVSWGNDGINDVPAPYIVVGADRPIGINPDFTNNARYSFIGVGQDDGPAGVLRPGQTSQREFYARNGARGEATRLFADRLVDDKSRLFDWNATRQDLIPSDYSDEAFDAAFARMIADIGPTWGDYLRAIGESASLIPDELGVNRLDTSVLHLNFLTAAAKVNTSLSGRVFAADIDVPIAGRTVVATNTATGQTYSAVSWNDGTFVFDRIAAGQYALSYDAGTVAAGGTVTVAAGQHATGQVLTIERGGTITGTVRNAANVPVAGARVTVLSAAGAQKVETDADGRYELLGFAAGTYTVFVDAPGLARGRAAGLTLDAGGTRAANFQLAPASVVKGNVITPVGPNTPIVVTLRQAGAGIGADTTYAARLTGNAFQFDGLPAGDYELVVSRRGYQSHSANVTVAAGQTLSLGDINLAIGATVSGRVVGVGTGVDVRGSVVGVYSGETAVGSAQIAPDGTFQIFGIPAGSYVLKTSARDAFADEIPITLTTGQQLSGLTVNVAPGGAIGGTVTRQDTGAAVAGVTVSLADALGNLRSTATDASGNYAFEHLPLGAYAVRAYGVNQPVTVGALTGPAADVDVALPVAGTVTGTLTNGVGQPVRGFVRVYAGTTYVGSTQANAQGRYELLVRAAGAYTLLAESTGGTFGAVNVNVTTGANLVQNFAAGSRKITVNVTDNGAPANDAVIQVKRLTGVGAVDVGHVALKGQSAFTFNALQTGEYRVRVFHANGKGSLQTVTLGASDLNLSVAIATEPSVTGTITGPGGAPVVGAKVVLLPPGGMETAVFALTDASGAYTIANAVAGTYTLAVIADGRQTVVQSDFAVDGVESFSTELADGGGVITGRLVDDTGAPIAGGHVSVTNAAGDVLLGTAVIGADGTFRVSGPVGENLTVRITTRGADELLVVAQTVVNGETLSLGDRSVTPLFYGSDGPAATANLTARAARQRVAPAAIAAPANLGAGDVIPTFLYALSDSLSDFQRSGNHVELSQILPMDKCGLCVNSRARVLQWMNIQDSWYDATLEAQDYLGDLVGKAIQAFALDFARNAGIIPKLILTFEGIAAFAATLGPAIVASEVPAGVSALGLGTFNVTAGLAYAITQIGEAGINLVRAFWEVPQATSAKDALDKLGALDNI
ncbi:MAG TPA: carboxypeptidase regulatory-like domain-containing protein, partial [Tepidisphaeraceae bacterium]